MSDRLKRLLVVLGFVAIVIIVAVGIYFVFFRTPPVPAGPPSVEGNTQGGTIGGGLPTSGSGGVSTPSGDSGDSTTVSKVADGGATKTERLTSSAIAAPTLASDGKGMAYYDPTDGRFYKISSDGKVESLSDKQFLNAETIVWNDTATSVVIEFPDGANIVFDFGSEQQTTLPAHWEDFDFSPDGTQVISKSITTDAAARALVITNKDGSNTEVIEGLGENADLVDVAWSPNDAVIAFADTGAQNGSGGIGRKTIYPVGKNQENFKGLVVEGINFHAIWSPDGSRILYDVSGETSNYKPLLWIVDGTPTTMGDHRASLGLNTWVEKCTFASNTVVYCAVPITLSNNAGLQPATVTANDSVYRIDLASGRVKLVGYPEQATQMTHLTLSTDGTYLYYMDTIGRLQVMRLR